MVLQSRQMILQAVRPGFGERSRLKPGVRAFRQQGRPARTPFSFALLDTFRIDFNGMFDKHGIIIV